ncbi:MAG: pyruvate kinase [Firmicutes bacterium]|nr:pyruvate kinase [Bacillota bacterium]MCM1400577.1 pyruvate kinase [Bacteroides sp.]MCM1476481.1 pyruvate kinase [Bacteroides sp.]
MKHTSIMATVANNRCTAEFVSSLHRNGMESVRINSAHVSPETFREMVETIRNAAPGIQILMDTKGPEIRTTRLARELELKPGDKLTFRSGTAESGPDCIYIRVDGFEKYVVAGGEMLLDDGELKLVITTVENDGVTARVITGGKLGSCKTVAFTGAEVPPLPAVSERDRLNISAAVECGIEMIAHSFVRSAADVKAVRELISGSNIRLYAKVECREALENLEEIAAAADGLLIARGDLGTHISLCEVPAAQFKVVAAAQRVGKPTILATQILQSMLNRPTPTRAELSDITLAVLQGIDTLLLTGETARGEFPAECVATLKQSIHATRNIPWKLSMTT